MSSLARLRAGDVGLRRLRTALAATLTTSATLALLLGLAGVLGRGASFAVPGVLVTAVATMAVGMDPDSRHRSTTTLWMCVPGTAGLVLGAVCVGRPLLTAVVFTGLAVSTLAGSLLGSRGILLPLSAIGVFYGAGQAAVPVDDLPVHALAVVVAAVVSALLLGPVLGGRPTRQGIRDLRSLHALTGQVVTAATAHDRRATDRAVERLADAVDLTRARIEADPQQWPVHLQHRSGAALADLVKELEGAVEEVLDGGDERRLAVLLDSPTLDESRLTPHRRRHGSPQRPGKAERGSDRSGTAPSGGSSGEEPSERSVRSSPAASGGRSQVSMAVQLLVATLVALPVSMLIDVDRWFWGVLAALVMLFGTSSAAEAIGKGGRRVLGTATALPVGAALVTLTDHSLVAVVALLVVFLFCQQYTADVAYGWSIFFLTLFLYLLFSLSSAAADETLGLRLLLTGAGAAVGIAVALVVLPTRSGTLLTGRAVDVLDACDGVLAEVLAESADTSLRAGREMSRRYQQLTADARASRRGWPFSASHRVVAGHLGALGVAVLELETLAAEHADGQRLTPTYRPDAEQLRRRIQRLRTTIDRRAHPSAEDARAEVERGQARRRPPADRARQPIEATLLRTHQAVLALERRLPPTEITRGPGGR